jgi:transcriptional regulator with XRE-family HTH domain
MNVDATLHREDVTVSIADFPNRLVELCDTLGIRHQELAKAGGISKSSFSNYVHGLKYPRMEILANWVDKYGVSVSWLIMGEGPMMVRDLPHDHRGEPSAELRFAMNIAAAQAALRTMTEEEVGDYVETLHKRLQVIRDTD